MNVLELVLAGELPAGLDITPFTAVVAVINEQQPEWLQSGTIGLDLVDDASITALNEKYAGHDYATDVLSFSYMEDGAGEDGELGDIIISLETAQRQADEAGTLLADELGTLLAHGILHVFGFDHGEPVDREQMDALQKQIVQAAHLTYRDFKWTT